MKKLMAIILTVTMLLSSLTVLTSFAATETTVTPTVTLTDHTEGEILDWVVTNNTNATSYQAWYDNTNHIYSLEGFENAATIQTKRYEPANSPWKDVYLTNKQGTWATATVNNSCEFYVLYPLEASSSCGQWVVNGGFELVGPVTSGHATSPVTLYMYKKTINIYSGETVNIELGSVNPSWFNQTCSFVIKWTENLDDSNPRATITNNNNLGWVLTNDVDVSAGYAPWRDHAGVITSGVSEFKNVALIQTGRYECASGGVNYEFWKGKAADYVETVTVNHSCDFYVYFSLSEAVASCGKWILNDGYEYLGTTTLSTGNFTFGVYKKSIKLADGETAEIPVGGVNSNWFNQMCGFLVNWTENIKKIDATLTLANTNNLNWEVVNNTSITGDGTSKAYVSENKYYTDIASYDFSDVSYIRSYSQYEPAAEYYKSLYAKKTYETIETMTVDNSCEVYIITKWGYHQNYFQWLANYGYELQADPVKIGTTAHKVYKRAFYLKDGETLEIPLGAPNSNMVNEGYNVIVKWIENPEVTPARVSFTTLGDNAEYYTVTENAYAGEYIVINGGRKIASFNNSGLEGSYILKPFAGDKTDTDFGYMQKPEDETLIKDTDFYTVTIDKTATVYVASPGKYLSGSYMRWLADWQLVKDNEGNDVTITITNDDGSYNMEWVLYKKTFKVNDGETRTFALGNAVLYHNDMYATFFKFTDEDVYTVKLTVNGEGADIHPASDTDVLSGEALDFSFGITGDNYIKSIKFNGNEIYSDSDEKVVWKTPAITADSTVEVTMDSDENYPLPESISSVSKAFSAKGTEDLVVDYKVYKLNVIGFATAKAKIGPFARGEFGMLVALEKPESAAALTVENADVIKALADGSNDKGQYGIRLFGDSITSGQKCWMRAYAYYGDNVLYGTELIEAEF